MPSSQFPAVVKPITPKVFVQMAMIIEAGTALAKKEAEKSEGVQFSPGFHDLAVPLYDYIPKSYIPLGPGPPPLYVCKPYLACQETFDDDDRLGIATFQLGREALMGALLKATPPSTLAQLGDISGANAPGPEGGMNFWVQVIGAGGVLSWIGKSPMIARLATAAGVALSPRKKLILALGAGLLYAVGITGAVTEILPAAQEAAGNLYENLIQKPLESAGSVLSIVVGVGIVGVAGILLYNFAQSQTKRQTAIAA